jgi:hypothetical protein
MGKPRAKNLSRIRGTVMASGCLIKRKEAHREPLTYIQGTAGSACQAHCDRTSFMHWLKKQRTEMMGWTTTRRGCLNKHQI